MVDVLAWIVWIVVAYFALSLVLGFFRAKKAKASVTKATVYQGVFFSILAIYTLLTPSVSKFHLLWIAPIGFFLISFLTVAFTKQK